MVYTKKDKAFINTFYLIKGYGLRRLMREITGKDGKGLNWASF